MSSSEKAIMARKTYALLGLRPGCGETAIRKAYRDLSREFHPDKQSGKSAIEASRAASMFLKIKDAYELLSDDKKRAEFDAANAASERATKILNQRVAEMDATTRKMRNDLERREAEARAQQQSGSSTTSIRRKNAAATTAQEKRYTEAAKNRSAEAQAQRELRKRRALKVSWHTSCIPSDQDLDNLVRHIGPLESIERSARSAILVFFSEDHATNAAIDDSITTTFKYVNLCSNDAWQRLHTALKQREPQPSSSGVQKNTKSKKRKIDFSEDDLCRFGFDFAQYLRQNDLRAKQHNFESILRDTLHLQQHNSDNFNPQREFDILSRLLHHSSSS